MGEGHLHAEAGQQADDALRHRERFAVAGGVGPGHGDLFSAQGFERTKVVTDLEQIGQGLGGMVDIALEVYDCGPLVQDPFCKALVDCGRDLAHIAVAFAQEHVIADADRLGKEGDHGRGLAHGLAVGDLGFDLIQLGEPQSQGVDRGGEAEAGAGRVVAKDRDRQA